VEATNNKIKLTVRMGYGFRNIDNLVALVMLRCSNLPITLPRRVRSLPTETGETSKKISISILIPSKYF
jgi:hypothetical protein